MFTIGRLARKHGLSRSTLLYYDSIGLLKPSGRSESKYRQYSEEDDRRLAQICQYRKAGLPLSEIKNILQSAESDLTEVLENRIEELNEEISKLRDQQKFILQILKSSGQELIGVMNKKRWTSILATSGLSDEDMNNWHAEFERLNPEKHREFLEFLCIPEEEIKVIRSWRK